MEAQVILDLMKAEPQDRGLGPSPAIPTSVIVAGRISPLPPVLPFDTEAFARAAHRERVGRLRRWAYPPGEFSEASEVGHFIHQEAPDLVVAGLTQLMAIRR